MGTQQPQDQNRLSVHNADDQRSIEEAASGKEAHDEDGLGFQPASPHGDGILGRTLSRMTSRSGTVVTPAPDGGVRAWLAVLGFHIVVMNTWGAINSFGAFQTYYVDALSRSPADISWVGSIEIFLLYSMGVFSGRLCDAGLFYPVFAAGTVLVAAGTMTTSACTTYWQIFLAQGVCVGLGNGLLFCPTVAIVATYWSRRRSLAIGIGASGSVTGGIIFPLMVKELLPTAGFGWTMRAIGFIQMAMLIVALFSLKPRVPPRKTGSLVEWAAFKELEYTFYTLGTFLIFWGVYVPFFFLSAYSRDLIGLDYGTSIDLLVIMNGVGLIGRLLPTWLADRFGTLTMFAPIAGLSALMLFSWIAVSSAAGLYVWAPLTGIVLGGDQSLFPAALAPLTRDPTKQGTRIGMCFTIVSFSVLTGPPIAGLLISSLDGHYLGAQLFAGLSLAAGMLCLGAAREVKRRRDGISLWGTV